MKIFYWSPFLSNIATVKAVTRSINSIINYDKQGLINPYIIDAVGEWQTNQKNLEQIKIIKLYKKSIYKLLPKGSYLKSRLSQIIIFLFSIKNLKNSIIREKPDFLVAHLIISLPLFLFSIFNFKTKLIIRISGTPKLNIIRRYFWALFSKNIHKITCPTYSTYKQLTELKIFPEDKIEILFDPVLSVNEIVFKKKEPIDEKFEKSEYIIGIGRLTKQKNFKILIKAFKKISYEEKSTKLLILGEGEKRPELEKLIKDLNLEEKVFLLGYKKNIFNYLYNAKCFICSSLYEDPGFVILEAAFLNKIVIAADSQTGPSEILDNSERGFLFLNNNHEDLEKKYFEFLNSNKKKIFYKLNNLKKYSKQYTMFNHYKNIKKILTN